MRSRLETLCIINQIAKVEVSRFDLTKIIRISFLGLGKCSSSRRTNKKGNSLRTNREKAVVAVIRKSHGEDTKSRLRYMLGEGHRME